MRQLIAAVSLLAFAACSRDLAVPAPKIIPKPGGVSLVLSANGAPLAGAQARIASAGLTSTAGADGVVRFGGLAEGSYTLEAKSADGSSAAAPVQVSVFAGKVTDLGPVALFSSGSLHGTATFGAATGNAGIVVFVPLAPTVALAADDGTYQISGLAPGVYEVHATAPGHQLVTSMKVAVRSGQATDAGALVLPPVTTPGTGSISGNARRLTADGPRTDGIQVTLTGAGRATTASPLGVYSLAEVPEGRYVVAISADGALPATLYPVAVAAGTTTALPDVLLRDATGPDLDGDGIPDAIDPDIDGDGVPNELDAFPRDPTEWKDSDGDGIGDNKDNCPFVYNPDQADLDHNGIGDACEQKVSSDKPPVVTITGPGTVNQGQSLTLAVTATDPENEDVSLIARDLPAHSTFASTGKDAGAFQFAPSFAQSGSFTFTVLATDGHNLVEASKTVLVNVVTGNLPPTLTVQGATTVNEGDAVLFTVTATDPEGRAVTLSLVTGPPAAVFTDHGGGSGTLTWQTGYSDSGTYPITFRASDGQATTDSSVLLSVGNVIRAPSISAPVTLAATATRPLSFSVTAADPDGVPALSVQSAPLPGASFIDHGDGTGTFNWTPPKAAANSSADVTFAATVQGKSAAASTHLDIADVVLLPTITAPGRLSATEGVTLAFTVTAAVAGEFPAIAFRGAHPAAAALVDHGDGTAAFSWAPDAAALAAGGVDLVFVATSTGGSTTASTRIDVYPPLNRPPVLNVTGALVVDEGGQLVLNLVATDPESDPIVLFVSGAPTNASFADAGNGTGTFTFSPGFGQAGLYPVTFAASDGKAITTVPEVLNVRHVQGNTPPSLAVVGATHLSGGQAFDLALVASDPDVGQMLVLAASGTPAGAVFTDHGKGSGSFHWQTGLPTAGSFPVTFQVTDGIALTQQSVTLIVDKLNVAPVIAGPLAGRTLAVGSTLTQQLTATDANLDRISFAVAPAAHPGAALVDHGDGTATFTFTPTAADASSVQVFTFTASDGSLAGQQALQVTVPAPGNQPPVWDAVAAGLSVFEASTLTVNVRATDPNSDPITISTSQLPAHAAFTDHGDGTGTLVYSPDYSVATNANGGVATVTVGLIAADNHGATTPLSFTITVQNVNRPPTITHHADVTLGELASLPLVTTASDPDGNPLTYSFAITPPNSLGLNQTSLSSNTLTVTAPLNSRGTYQITATATDNASTPVTDVYNLIVVPQPILTVSVSGTGTITSSPPGLNCTAAGGTCTLALASGSNFVIFETAGTGQQFAGWSGACSGLGLSSSCSLVLNADTSAGVAYGVYTLGVTVTGAGTVSADSGVIAGCAAAGGVCAGGYPANAVVLLTALPLAGNALSSWGGSCAGTAGNACSVAMSASKTATASFAALTSLAVTQGDLQTAQLDAQLVQSVIVKATLQAGGAAAPGTPVALTGASGSAVIPLVATADLNGNATFTVRLSRTLGAQTFTASSTTAPSTVSLSATAVAPNQGDVLTLVNVGHSPGYDGFSGAGTTAHIGAPRGLALSSNGTLYISDYSYHSIYALDPAGALTLVAGNGAYFNGSTGGTAGDGGPAKLAQFFYPGDLALDERNGKRRLYVADSGNSRIRVIDLLANPPTIANYAGGGTPPPPGPGYGDTLPATSATLSNPVRISIGPDGFLYIGDADRFRVRRVDLGTGIIDNWLSGDGYTCSAYACTVNWDAAGAPYLGRTVNGVTFGLFRVGPAQALTLVAGTGASSAEGAYASLASLGAAPTVAFDPAGNLLLADQGFHKIRRVDPAASRIVTVAGTGAAGFAVDHGPASGAQLNAPWTAILDPAGNLLIADTGNSAVRMIWAAATSTAAVSSLSYLAPGDLQSVPVDQILGSMSVKLLDPAGKPMAGYPVAWKVIDAGGALYSPSTVTNASGIAATQGRVGLTPGATWRFSASATDLYARPIPSTVTFTQSSTAFPSGYSYTSVDANHSPGFDVSGGPATLTHIGQPKGLVYGSDGTLYIADFTYHSVYALSPSGVLALVAGTGSPGFSNDGFPATTAQLNSPADLVLDESSGKKLYIADVGNNRVRVVDLTQVPPGISTFAGGGNLTSAPGPAYGDAGSASAAVLSVPNHLALNGDGYLYISDTGHDRIRRVNTTGGPVISAWLTLSVNNCGFAACALAFTSTHVPYLTRNLGSYYFDIVRLDPSGGTGAVVLPPIAGGSNIPVANTADGLLATSSYFYPPGLAFDSADTLYLVDGNVNGPVTHRVRKLSNLTATATITTVAGTGTAGNGVDGPVATQIALANPWTVAFSPLTGKMAIADSVNNCVREIAP